MKSAKAIGAVCVLVIWLGCATTKAVSSVASQCEPSTAQETAILGALSNPAQAAALAEVDALGFALCVLQKGVDEIIAAVTPKPGTTAETLTAAAYSPVLDNARAWRAAHP